MKILYVIAIVILLLTSLFEAAILVYEREDQAMFIFLSSDPSLATLQSNKGDPELVYKSGELIPGLGWKPPKLQRGFEVWVYTIKTGRRFFVHVNKRENRIEYVFTSSS